MASEASMTDQTVTEQIETNVSDDISNTEEASLSKIEDLKRKEEEQNIETNVSDDVKPEDLEGKGEEEKVENSVSDDISNADEASLAKLEDLKGKYEEEKIKEENSTSVEGPTPEPEESPEQGGTVIEEVKEEAVDKIVSEMSVETEEKEPIDKSDITIELPNEPVEQPAEVSEASVTEDPVETPKEIALLGVVTEEPKVVEESSEVSPLVTDDKPIEPPTISLVQEPAPDTNVTPNSNETEEKSQDGEPVSDGIDVSPGSSEEKLPRNETVSINEDPTKVHETIKSESSEAIAVVPSVNEPKEVQEETVVPELPTEKTVDDQNADLVIKESSEESVSATGVITTEIAESAMEPEVDVKKEKEENNIDVEKTTVSETTQAIAENEVAGISEELKAPEGVEVIGEVKNESLEGEKVTSVETSRDIDIVGAENNGKTSSKDPECDTKELDTEPDQEVKQTLLDKMINESSEDKKQETEEVNDQTLAEATKDSGDTKTDGDAPITEVSGKKSYSRGNNIISKVKKSIVKVKRAIIGKSPSSKTMTPEGK